MRKYALVLWLPLVLAGAEIVDIAAIHRIKDEAFRNSQVMEHAFYLADVHGPRLTGSPGYEAAAAWAMKTLRGWGLTGVRKEDWGPYGRGWTNERFYAALKEPGYQPLIAVPRPFSLGTDGPAAGPAVLAPLRTDADFERFKGKLKGKVVLLEDARPVTLQGEPLSRRYTDAELASTALAPEPGRPPAPRDRRAQEKFRDQLNRFLRDEGALVALVPGFRGDGGTVFAAPAGSREPGTVLPPPSVAVAAEHYNRIVRLLKKDIPVTLEFDIRNRVYDEPGNTFNVLADLPGGDRADEVVLLGAHLDSWTFGTGAADNAAGCAVMMEAMRILKALDVKLPRTVRLALWSAEEQGLLGSAAYVRRHLADRETMKLAPEHARLSGYFNLDNGGGKIRGVYLQGNDMMRPIFEAWLAPFRDLGAAAVSIRNTGGTDHLPFDAVGLPAFQFIQDPIEYGTRTHHSNMDVLDRLHEGDLMQASAILAAVAYHAATRPGLLPRKPLPKPAPAKAPAR